MAVIRTVKNPGGSPRNPSVAAIPKDGGNRADIEVQVVNAKGIGIDGITSVTVTASRGVLETDTEPALYGNARHQDGHAGQGSCTAYH